MATIPSNTNPGLTIKSMASSEPPSQGASVTLPPPSDQREVLQALLAFSTLHEQIRRKRKTDHPARYAHAQALGAYTAADRSYTYGQAGDLPVVGDWDSSGTPNKIGVYRAGLWILDYDGDGVLTTPALNEMSIGFGFSGYSPLVF